MTKHYLQWALLLLITMGSVMALSVSDVSFDTQYGYLWRGLNHTVSADVEDETSTVYRYAVNGVYTDVFNLPLWSYLLNSTHVEGITHNVTHNYVLRNGFVNVDVDFGTGTSGTTTKTQKSGFKINVTETSYLTSFIRKNTGYGSYGYILDSSYNVLRTHSSFASGLFIFDPPFLLEEDTIYYLAVDNDGANYYISNNILSYPTARDRFIILNSFNDGADSNFSHMISDITTSTFVNNLITNDTFEFNGADDFLWIRHSNALNIVGDLTISAWIHKDDAGGRSIVTKNTGNGATNTPFAFYAQYNSASTFKLRFGVANASSFENIDSTITAPINEWNHVVVTRSGLDYSFYINGVQNNRTGTITPTGNTRPVYIGTRDDFNTYFNGDMNQILIYNKKLSSDEVNSIYQRGRNNITPVGGAILQFRAQYYNDSQVIDHHYLVQDDERTSYNFDGVNEYSEVIHDTSLNIVGDLAISAWIHKDDVISNSIVTKNTGNGATNTPYAFYAQYNSASTYKLRFSVANASNFESIDSTITAPINEWNHVVVTRSGLDYSFYINGVQNNRTGTITPTGNTRPVYIGTRDDFNNYFNGQIANVQIFNKTLSAQEVNLLYAGNNQYYGMSASRGDDITATVYATNLTHTMSSSVTEELTNLMVNVTARGYVLNETINNFSGYVSDQYGNTINYNTTTGNYTAIFNLPSNITSYVTASGYSILNFNNLILREATTPTINILHELYEANKLFITFRDEDTNDLITENITITVWGTNFTYTNTTSDNPVIVPVEENNQYIIFYSAEGYSQRTYTLSIDQASDVNLTLYLLNSTETTTPVVLNVYDQLGNSVPGAYIKILRFIPAIGAFQLVEVTESNYEGQSVTELVLNTGYYQFIIEYEGAVVYTSTPTYVYATILNFYINIGGIDFSDLFDQFGLGGSITFNNNTHTATFVWNDNNNVATNGCLYAYRTGQYYEPILVNSTCANGAAGSISVSVENITGRTYQFKGYATQGGVNRLVATLIYKYDTPNPDNTAGLFFLFILMVISLAIYMWNEIVATLMVFIMPLLFSIGGLIPIGLSITIPLFLVGLIIAVILGVNKR